MERSQTPQRGAGLASRQINQLSFAFIKCPLLMYFSPGHRDNSLTARDKKVLGRGLCLLPGAQHRDRPAA